MEVIAREKDVPVMDFWGRLEDFYEPVVTCADVSTVTVKLVLLVSIRAETLSRQWKQGQNLFQIFEKMWKSRWHVQFGGQKIL